MEASASRPRSSHRMNAPERRREAVTRKSKYNNTGLDVEAFARRTKFLREVFLDPERRHLHQWTATEKKILALDWFHNPSLYRKWTPGESEDMASRLYSNLVFNYSHLAMINVGSTVILCRLINEFVNISGNYQLFFMVVRSEIGEQQMQDMLRVGLIWRGEQTSETLAGTKTLVYTAPKSEDFQCLSEGISFNIHSFTIEELRIYNACESCQDRKTELRTRLCLPEVRFKSHVAGLEVTSAIVESRRNYLAAVQKVDGTVHIIDMTKMLQVTLDLVHKWKILHDKYVKRCSDFREKLESSWDPTSNTKSQRYKSVTSSGKPIQYCTGCLLGDDELKALDALRQQATEFTLPSHPITCKGLDVTDTPYKGVPIRRLSLETTLSFIYTSIENLKVIVPMYVAALGATRICLWRIGDVNDAGVREPFMVMEFPEGSRPTDVTATLGIAKDYVSLLSNKFLHEPQLYASDDSGFLRMWTLGASSCDASVKIDTHPLLSVDVNMMYPNMIAIGVETGKIKLYNIWKQCMTVEGHPPEVDFVRMTTVPSYLPHNVYEYLSWYHPVVKVKWVNATMVMAQYAEPLFVRESANVSTVAIWNLAKDIFDRNDAILCNRSWAQDMTHTWHLASRLVCLHGGHYGSLGGVISSDCRWSPEHGLIAISSDATGQLHVYKPGIWAWTDYDDALCLARFRGDADFHSKIYERVSKEHETLMKRSAGDVMASSDLRKHRAKFAEFMEVANRELRLIESQKTLKNDFSSLPVWAKHTLKLNTNCERLMKQIQKNLRDCELMEHSTSHNPVER
ncbi:uncharacterized protein BXIN_1292 [Babesia sp. Xinjiang]|uniref:uncharacterized protein n=1 Tax=Babesia sp. Xinjiang TaxID=462227 RepID=UPI000A253F22|nr:uncharacterized protein BXIN_1292 [Babesia sp. Xinjiang]ORM39908.1 hypothetical protein BXIN_1292 [Babesia sp. Xinjiang]